MMCNGSIGYLSHNTSHYYFCHFNDDKKSYEEEVIEVYLGVESNGYMYLDTINIPQVIMEVMKLVDIGIKRPATISQLITDVIDVHS